RLRSDTPSCSASRPQGALHSGPSIEVSLSLARVLWKVNQVQLWIPLHRRRQRRPFPCNSAIGTDVLLRDSGRPCNGVAVENAARRRQRARRSPGALGEREREWRFGSCLRTTTG